MSQPDISERAWEIIGYRAVADFAIGAGLFLLLLALSGHLPHLLQPNQASAMGLEVAASGIVRHDRLLMAATGPARATAATFTAGALACLGLTFSVLFAFNRAIFRHLRRVYASPRRDG
jgi:hypothetical protein